MNNNQLLIWYASINLLPIKKYRIFKEIKDIRKIYKLSQNDLLKIDGIDLFDVAEIEKSKKIELIKKYEEYITKNEISVISISNESYPEKLKNIYDPPIVLFAKGKLELLNEKSIAIVGSRDANEYGKKQSYEIAYNLALNEITVISGLAKGIDTMAHYGSLNAKGNTIAVVGSGLDIVYPTENLKLYQNILKNGLVISEFIVGTRPIASNFPMRNRIVAALSDKILVVQARKRSGAMITVDFALEYGKDVYAVPGNIDNYFSEGCNLLIKDGAKLATSYKDILEDFT